MEEEASTRFIDIEPILQRYLSKLFRDHGLREIDEAGLAAHTGEKKTHSRHFPINAWETRDWLVNLVLTDLDSLLRKEPAGKWRRYAAFWRFTSDLLLIVVKLV